MSQAEVIAEYARKLGAEYRRSFNEPPPLKLTPKQIADIDLYAREHFFPETWKENRMLYGVKLVVDIEVTPAASE
mgnify:FL=1